MLPFFRHNSLFLGLVILNKEKCHQGQLYFIFSIETKDLATKYPLSAFQAFIMGIKEQKNQSQNFGLSWPKRGWPVTIKISTPLTTLEVQF